MRRGAHGAVRPNSAPDSCRDRDGANLRQCSELVLQIVPCFPPAAPLAEHQHAPEQLAVILGGREVLLPAPAQTLLHGSVRLKWGTGWRRVRLAGPRTGPGECAPLERLVTRKTPRASRLPGCRRPGGPSTPGWRPPGCLRWARSCRRPRRWPAWPCRVGGVRSRPHPRSSKAPVPFKANAARRHRIPKQRHRVTNWAEYDAALRQRGSLTVWFSEAAIAAWRAEPRTTPGGQPSYSALAIITALTLRAVFRLALRQTEGLIGSILRLLGLGLAVPDHTTLSRRAETLEVPRSRS